MNEQRPDQGFTLIEALLVILVLGLLAAVVIAASDGFTARAARNACASDRTTLQVAAEAFFAQRHTDVIPAADATADGVEQTLADEGFIHDVSSLHDVSPTGLVTATPTRSCAG
jgi:prepilin-type N-terminal cleavage/methylation domain-containing protein